MLRLVAFLSVLYIAFGGDAEDARTLADANTDFALRFYKKLTPLADNIIFSPYSISTALAMAAAGAKGNTLNEMREVLGYKNIKEADVNSMSSKLMKVLNENDNKYNISLANKLFGEETFTIKEDFLTRLRDSFDTTLEKVDYINKWVEARETINDWVEEITKDKIKDLLSEDAVTTYTRLYIVNAIYFGALWLNPFEKDANMENQDFYVSETMTKQVTMMSRQGLRGNYGYAELQDLDAKLLEMPYTDPNVAMYVLLPNDKDGLSKLQGQLKASDFSITNTNNIFSKLDRMGVKVDVRLPKFEMTLPIQPKEILSQMGMIEAFTNGADFTGIVESPRLKISDVVHKAFINVHEGGTEAAAATAIGMVPTSIDISEPKTVYADHPFIFWIYEKSTGTILFMGQYKTPPAAGGEEKAIGKPNYEVDPTGSASFAAASFLTMLFSVIAGMVVRW